MGLLIDWLQLLCPEIVGSPTTSVESQLDLLFGRRSPDVGRVMTRRLPHSGSYLLALLAHQSSWTNVNTTLVLLLESRSCVDRYEALAGNVAVGVSRDSKVCHSVTSLMRHMTRTVC